MSSQLLITKLFAPQVRPTVVARPRLGDRLNEGMRVKLTLVCAPAGFGKSTLLSEWRMMHSRDEYPFAWVALDEDDNERPRTLPFVPR